jgi:hypothetical protein
MRSVHVEGECLTMCRDPVIKLNLGDPEKRLLSNVMCFRMRNSYQRLKQLLTHSAQSTLWYGFIMGLAQNRRNLTLSTGGKRRHC